jgi:hypothetical protein
MQYKTGTVSVTNGSPTVTGSGTSWNSLSTPLYFKIDADGAPVYEVASIDSDTQLTLAGNYQGTTQPGLQYQLVQDFSAYYGFPLPSQGDADAGDWIRRAIVEIDAQIAQGVESAIPFVNFADGDATPSVKLDGIRKFNFKTQNSAATTITMFDDGADGQEIWVVFGDGNTTIDFSGANLKGNGGMDWSPAQGDHMIAKFDGTNWYCAIFLNS